MPKRKSGEREEDYLRRKLKKYKKKLDKISLNPQEVNDQENYAEIEIDTGNENEPPEHNRPAEENTPPNGNEVDDEIPEEFLRALGNEGEEKEDRGEEIRPELANRWAKLMSTGLGKEPLETILKKYPIPSNLDAEAPKMNPEIFASLSELTVKRDSRIVHRQNLTGKVLCALGSSLTSILKGEINSKLIIEQVNDAAKICTEIFYQDSSSRRFFAMAGANQTVKDAVRDSKPDTLLFGTNCAENIKAAQTLKKAGAQIKATDHHTNTPQNKSTKQQPTNNIRKQGNWRGPPQQFQQRARGGYRRPPTRKYYQQQRDQKRSYRTRHNYRR